MAMRILETHEIVAVPERLYCVRRHRGRRTHLPVARLRFWVERVLMVGSLLRRRAISYPRTHRYRASKWLLRDLGAALGLERAASSTMEMLGRIKARTMRWARRATRATAATLHGSTSRLLSHWPAPRRRVAVSPVASPRIVYFLWQYPVASQTFIRRELAALRRLGVAVVVVAEERGVDAATDLDGAPAALYLSDVARGRTVDLMVRRLIRHPWSLSSLALWVVGRRYGPVKSWREDCVVLGRAARLAAVLEREGATRVHAPWADRIRAGRAAGGGGAAHSLLGAGEGPRAAARASSHRPSRSTRRRRRHRVRRSVYPRPSAGSGRAAARADSRRLGRPRAGAVRARSSTSRTGRHAARSHRGSHDRGEGHPPSARCRRRASSARRPPGVARRRRRRRAVVDQLSARGAPPAIAGSVWSASSDSSVRFRSSRSIDRVRAADVFVLRLREAATAEAT